MDPASRQNAIGKPIMRRIRKLITKTVSAICHPETNIQRETIHFTDTGKITIWSFIAIENKSIVQVDIRQIENQEKHFYSLVYRGVSPKVTK